VMKDNDMPKRPMLIAAVAMFLGALAVASCDQVHHGDGDAGVSGPLGTCEPWCEKYHECLDSDFHSYYDSLGDCEQACEDSVTGQLHNMDPACEDEYVAYVMCKTELSCDDFSQVFQGDVTVGDCGDELAAYQACWPSSVQLCQVFEEAINDMECFQGAEVDLECETYKENDCNLDEFFNCVWDCYTCDGDTQLYDEAYYNEECLPLATCE
jgi:hypothetical protein